VWAFVIYAIGVALISALAFLICGLLGGWSLCGPFQVKQPHTWVVPAALVLGLGVGLDRVAGVAVWGTGGDRATSMTLGMLVAMLAFIPAVVCLALGVRACHAAMATGRQSRGVGHAVLWFCCVLPMGFTASFIAHMHIMPVQEVLAASAIAEAIGVDYRHPPNRRGFPADYFVMQTMPGETTRTEARSIMRYAERRWSCDAGAEAAARWSGFGMSGKSADLYSYLSPDISHGQLAVLVFDENDVLVARRTPEESEYGGFRIEGRRCEPF
jgi:hypothetical protein